MCGVGGITIAAARLGKSMYASDINDIAINSAKKNAEIYEVGHKIIWNTGGTLDISLSIAKSLNGNQTLYLDQPWDGTDYYKKFNFKFSDFSLDVSDLITRYLRDYGDVLLSAPNNFDLQEIKNITRNFIVFPSSIWGRDICLNILMRS